MNVFENYRKVPCFLLITYVHSKRKKLLCALRDFSKSKTFLIIKRRCYPCLKLLCFFILGIHILVKPAVNANTVIIPKKIY